MSTPRVDRWKRRILAAEHALTRVALRLLEHWRGPELAEENDRLWHLLVTAGRPLYPPCTRARIQHELEVCAASHVPAGVVCRVELLEQPGIVTARVTTRHRDGDEQAWGHR